MRLPDDALPEELERGNAPFIEIVGQVFGRRGEPLALEEVRTEAIARVFERLQMIEQQAKYEGTQVPAPVREWPVREHAAGDIGPRRSSPRSRWQPTLNLIAACLVLSLLVGSMLMVFNAIRHQSAPSPAARDKQALIWGYSGPAVTTLDPALASDPSSVNAVQLVFSSLVQSNGQHSLDGRFRLWSQMATSWAVSTDGLSWTFHIRKDLTFSDGTPITSRDIAYSLDRALSPSLIDQGGSGLTSLGLIRGASERAEGKLTTIIGTGVFAPDPHTIRIQTTRSSISFLDALASPAAAVVEESLIDRYGAAWSDHLNEGGASGPFKVQSWQRNTSFTVVPNTHYQGSQARVNKVEYVPYRDGASLYHAFLAGQVDIADVTPDQYQAARTNNAFTATPSFQIDYVGMNYLSRPFDNIKVRQALSLAIDREAFNQRVNDGAFIPTCHLIPQGMETSTRAFTCPDLKGDPALA
nr:ABC transporter substrate-binding protein [Chloroflexota bacterium]